MKKILIATLATALSLAAFANNGPKLIIKPVCCRFEGWKGIEISIPNVIQTTNFNLQYKNSLSDTNWINVTPDSINGPFVEDGVWVYYFWHTTPTNSVPMRFWRIGN
jgi:hypothetical protein